MLELLELCVYEFNGDPVLSDSGSIFATKLINWQFVITTVFSHQLKRKLFRFIKSSIFVLLGCQVLT